MPTMSYAHAMGWLAERDPDAVSIIHGDLQATRGQLEHRSNRLARAYQKLGVGEGDLISIALPNGIEFFEACMACWKLGAVPNPISARLPEIERRTIVETANPALLVGAEQASRTCLPAHYAPDPSLSDAPLAPSEPGLARAMTSGGSTGRPKVIVDASPACCDPSAPENRMRSDATTLTPGPLYHAGPFITSWQQILCGGCVVVMDRFEPQAVLALIERHRVSWVLFVPTMMQRIWRLPESQREAYDLSSLETVMCTGAPSPVWLKRAWIEWLGAEKIFEAYGGSERIGGTQISGTEWLEHPGSVGKPTGGRKMKVLDEEGSELPAGQIGEVYMLPPGGQGSTYRYVGDTARATAEGWETLGDMGYLDEDGYLYLVDRKTDMILCGGVNVFPAEVEAAIDLHPAVRSSAVVGLPDEDLGQRVHAIVDAPEPPSEDALRAHLAEHLVRYKVPRSFEFVDSPLRDDAGKVRRSALREARLSGISQQPQ